MRQDLPKNQVREEALEISEAGLPAVVTSEVRGANSIGPSQQLQAKYLGSAFIDR